MSSTEYKQQQNICLVEGQEDRGCDPLSCWWYLVQRTSLRRYQQRTELSFF